MATQALMPVEEYLRKHFEREPEYRDGMLEERPLPDFIHSLLQAFFIEFFLQWTRSDRLTVVSELRVQLRSGRYVLPDICIFEGAPTDNLPDSPPLAVVEVLSPDDTHAELIAKLGEYHQWGVPSIWVVDPDSRTRQVFDGGRLQPTDAFALVAYGIGIPQAGSISQSERELPEKLADLDELDLEGQRLAGQFVVKVQG